MSIRRSAATAALTLVYTACFPSPETLEELVPDDPKAAAHAVLRDIRTNDLDAIERTLHSDVDVAEARRVLAPILGDISHASSFEARFGSWNWVYRNSIGQHELVYEVTTDDEYLIVKMVFRKQNVNTRLAGIWFQRMDSSLIEANRFTLSGKSAVHYLFLAAGVAIPAFCLTTLFACWRRRPERRWLWLLFIAVAFPVAKLNWSTGDLSFHLLSLNLLGASLFQGGPLQPFYLQLGLPIGALVFWLHKPEARPKPETHPSAATVA